MTAKKTVEKETVAEEVVAETATTTNDEVKKEKPLNLHQKILKVKCRRSLLEQQ